MMRVLTYFSFTMSILCEFLVIPCSLTWSMAKESQGLILKDKPEVCDS